MRVFVVSDDPLVRDEARYGFPEGVEVEFAADAREAATRLSRRSPTVVVVDMQTGNAGGYALTRYMAESKSLAGVPTLVLLERPQDAWLARNAGATAHRTKPLAPGELALAVLALAKPG
jgi:DNA-binding response OmpR family regulator